MCFFVVFILSHFKNLPSDDTREAPILFILYHEQWLWTWYVRNEHTSSSNRIESFYWNPLLRPDCIRTQEKKKSWWRGIQTNSQHWTWGSEPKDMESFLDHAFLPIQAFYRYHPKVSCVPDPMLEGGGIERDSHMAIMLMVREVRYVGSQCGKWSWPQDLHGAYMATHEEQGLCWEELVA